MLQFKFGLLLKSTISEKDLSVKDIVMRLINKSVVYQIKRRKLLLPIILPQVVTNIRKSEGCKLSCKMSNL